ncbi:hypothetical protein [Erythrobacter litoralis]|uniref:Uncharacterized protein n=1 Tax=Erythrobacter litoralis (strain HTCC2594) TaxID=314225 RepID=Q2NC29_ERYLH|nr:hypothetical protein [Erythrobacter litoralis]ABC62762.1 hypothetical protein ELI_03350 [Erythrobacter litoralis HTCC2594]
MSMWTGIVLIVLIASVAQILRARYRARSGIIADKQGNETYVGRDDGEKDREIAELRERVKVLERIATDPARRTADEIEKLRDER